ncbi:MAG: class I SAM-dependent methyltransferase [Promethearchaeota archaeon]
MDLKEAKSILDVEFSFHADFAYQVVEELKLKKSAKVLDIGTGFGNMAIILALQGYKVTTGEPEGHNWANWQESARKLSLEDLITFKFFRAEELPFEINSFDAVFCLTSLHHIADKKLAIEEFLRVLVEDGVIVIFELNQEGVKIVKERMPSHPEAINPKEYSRELPLSVNIKKGRFIDGYIYKRV